MKIQKGFMEIPQTSQNLLSILPNKGKNLDCQSIDGTFNSQFKLGACEFLISAIKCFMKSLLLYQNDFFSIANVLKIGKVC